MNLFYKFFPKIIEHQLFHQFGLKKGIQIFGEKGRQAALKEMEQLHLRKCFKPLSKYDLTATERKKALESLIFLKERDSGEIKGRAVANGCKQ